MIQSWADSGQWIALRRNFLTDPRLILCGFAAVASLVVAISFLAGLKHMSWRSRPSAGLCWPIRLSVIIPARDEEQDLAEGLRSVLAQTDVELEVIVVNDHSSDRTGAIAESFAAADRRVRDSRSRPTARLAGQMQRDENAGALATGEVLLFTDADIVHAPRCFVTGLAEMETHELDFLSLFPRMRCVSVGENIIVPALVGGVAMMATPGINDPSSPDARGRRARS